MELRILTILSIGIALTSAFTSNDDKFIKKYAMMKIYESCFGAEVIQQIREEMKIAVAKCAAREMEHPPPQVLHKMRPTETTTTTTTEAPQPSTNEPNPIPLVNTIVPDASQYLDHNTKGLFSDLNDIQNTLKSTFDPDKLHQAILGYRPFPFQNNFPQYASPSNSYFAASPYSAPFGYYQTTRFNPSASQYSPFVQPLYISQRLSRQMDLNADSAKTRLNGRVKNVTCVMQELGYIDDNLEPTYDKIINKVNSLGIHDDLKKDIEEGVEFCRQFSQCIPETTNEKSPFSHSLMKPMFFFKCYKHKKLEACIMKDVRDRFTGINEESFESITEGDLLRRGKNARLPNSHERLTSSEEMTSAVFDFLYGNQMDLDGIF